MIAPAVSNSVETTIRVRHAQPRPLPEKYRALFGL